MMTSLCLACLVALTAEQAPATGQPLPFPGFRPAHYTGLWKALYPDGTRVEEQLRDGKLDGLAQSWHKNGKKAGEGRYAAGLRMGKHTTWHENGAKASEGEYQDGQPIGTLMAWHDNRKVAYEAHFVDGKLQGPWLWRNRRGRVQGEMEVEFFEGGIFKSQVQYRDGKREGASIEWFYSGPKKREEHYRNGKLHGTSRTWHLTGAPWTLTEYRDGKMHGKCIGWYPNGWKDFEAEYKHGERLRVLTVPVDTEPDEWGAEQARKDLAKGIKRFFHCGAPWDGQPDSESGWPIVDLGSCTVDGQLAAKAALYNAAMRTAAKASE